MHFISNLGIGFGEALTAVNLFYCFIGCLLGTLIGVLPGIGPAATIAMLLPITYTLDPTTSLIMLAGIYYGAQYGGSTTAILVNLPGEASSIVTALDGHQLAKQGRGGAALSTAALGSFAAGCIATLVIALFAPTLANLALNFGAAEYFSLMLLGLVASVVLARGSLVKALGMIIVGLLIGIVGTDGYSGIDRFTFGQLELSDGVSLVAVAMGMFGLAEIIENLAQGQTVHAAFSTRLRDMLPTRAELRAIAAPILRGTALGTVLGILPGGGALISSFAAYALEKKLSSHPERFGRGAIEGVAAPESANNAGAQTSFIPMLTLGIPSNVIIALMAGAMIMQGIQPGPGVIRDQPQLFWGLVVSMWIGNLMLVILNLPLINVWVRLLTIPYHYLFPAIMVFCGIGVYTLANSTVDLDVLVLFGLLGYVFRKLECEPAPMLLGMVLGPMMEEYLRRSLLLSRGDPSVFFTRPLSASLLAVAAIAIVAVAVPHVRRRRDLALEE
jgi:TctA family transporter